MRPFDYRAPTDPAAAVALAHVTAAAHVRSPVQFMGGGTTLIDLMKLDVMRPELVIDIGQLRDDAMCRIERMADGVRIGALVSMAELAADPAIKRDFPLLSESLWLAASPQLRNAARLGGNVLQRTRCPYFRDTSYTECNKRAPGSGCAARNGHNRPHAVLGVSDQCIATYAGDWAQALIALDAKVEILGGTGARTIAFADLHRTPGKTPHIESRLVPGDLIVAFTVPGGPWRRSLYRKVRDRESYAFANASAAVALDLDGDRVRDVRIALGGVATVPWRARLAERSLRGKRLTETAARDAAAAEFAAAQPAEHNAFKVPLGQAVMVCALLEAQAMEVA